MRHRTRHLHATMVAHVRGVLETNDWLADPPVNFTSVLTKPITLLDFEPQQAGVPIAENTVSVSLGEEGADDPFEMGNFLSEVRIPMFVDIYPVNETIGIALADDLKAGLVEKVVPLLDFAIAPPAVTEGTIETEDVIIEQLSSAANTLDKRSWRAVKTVLLFRPPA